MILSRASAMIEQSETHEVECRCWTTRNLLGRLHREDRAMRPCQRALVVSKSWIRSGRTAWGSSIAHVTPRSIARLRSRSSRHPLETMGTRTASTRGASYGTRRSPKRRLGVRGRRGRRCSLHRDGAYPWRNARAMASSRATQSSRDHRRAGESERDGPWKKRFSIVFFGQLNPRRSGRASTSFKFVRDLSPDAYHPPIMTPHREGMRAGPTSQRRAQHFSCRAAPPARDGLRRLATDPGTRTRARERSSE